MELIRDQIILLRNMEKNKIKDISERSREKFIV